VEENIRGKVDDLSKWLVNTSLRSSSLAGIHSPDQRVVT
jgi:hypothetical protein